MHPKRFTVFAKKKTEAQRICYLILLTRYFHCKKKTIFIVKQVIKFTYYVKIKKKVFCLKMKRAVRINKQ